MTQTAPARQRGRLGPSFIEKVLWGGKNCPARQHGHLGPSFIEKCILLVTKTVPARQRGHLRPSFIGKFCFLVTELPLQGNVDTSDLVL